MYNKNTFTYYKLHKPFGYLSQFTQEAPNQLTLADIFVGPSDVYPIGRLDKDSEGLLLLSNDKQLVNKLLDPSQSKFKHYFVQVDGIINKTALGRLAEGVEIRINKKTIRTIPAELSLLISAPSIPERIPPVRYRKEIPTSWISIKLREGKNRQIRRMCAAVGFPALRIFRYQIGTIKLLNLEQGEFITLTDEEIRSLKSV